MAEKEGGKNLDDAIEPGDQPPRSPPTSGLRMKMNKSLFNNF